MPPKRSDLELAAKEMTEATHSSSYLSHVLRRKPQSDDRACFERRQVEQGQGEPRPYLSAQEAADLIGLSKKRIFNIVSAAKRKGQEFNWVLRQGRKRGFIVDRKKFVAWIERRAGRRGRPRKYEV